MKIYARSSSSTDRIARVSAEALAERIDAIASRYVRGEIAVDCYESAVSALWLRAESAGLRDAVSERLGMPHVRAWGSLA